MRRMPKVKRRRPAPRQISVRGDVYAKLKARAEADGVSIAALVESLVEDVPEVTP